MLFLITFVIQMQAAQIGNLISVIFGRWKRGAFPWLKISYIVKSYSIREGDSDHIVVPEGVCHMKMARKLGYWRNR